MVKSVAERMRTIWVFVDDPAMEPSRLDRWRDQPRHRVVFMDREARLMLASLPPPDVVVFGLRHVLRRDPWLEKCRAHGTLRILVSTRLPPGDVCDHHVPVEQPRRLCGHHRFVHG